TLRRRISARTVSGLHWRLVVVVLFTALPPVQGGAFGSGQTRLLTAVVDCGHPHEVTRAQKPAPHSRPYSLLQGSRRQVGGDQQRPVAAYAPVHDLEQPVLHPGRTVVVLAPDVLGAQVVDEQQVGVDAFVNQVKLPEPHVGALVPRG